MNHDSGDFPCFPPWLELEFFHSDFFMFQKPAAEGTAWWEYALIFAVLSYKIYTPLPEDIEDRYPRSFFLFGQKAIFKVGHYIRIISPSAELSYLRGATNGIAGIIQTDIEGVKETVHDLGNFNLHVFAPNDNGKKCTKNKMNFYISTL